MLTLFFLIKKKLLLVLFVLVSYRSQRFYPLLSLMNLLSAFPKGRTRARTRVNKVEISPRGEGIQQDKFAWVKSFSQKNASDSALI